jgi:hypothetical protein
LKLEFELILPETEIGHDLNVGVKVKNISSEDRKVKVRLTCASTFYTGVTGKKVKGEMTEVAIEGGAGGLICSLICYDVFNVTDVESLSPYHCGFNS